MLERCGRAAGLVLVGVLAVAADGSAQRLRLATHNVLGLGDPEAADGSAERAEWDALVAILRRGDADVAALQEVSGADDVALVGRLAGDAGFPEWAVSDISGTLSGGLRTACLSRWPIRAGSARSWSAAELSEAFGGVADPAANDITRDIFSVTVEIDGALPLHVFTVHLKSGGSSDDAFRRQVEIVRLLQAVELVEDLEGEGHVVVLGDFNEDPADEPFSDSWSDVPAGMPASYQLGSDVVLPLEHDPFGALRGAGLLLADATHEDMPDERGTFPGSGNRLDLAWLGGRVEACVGEVYESCNDDGIDGGDFGHWLPKSGLPLACGVSATASDHLAVLIDVRSVFDDTAPPPLGAALRVHSPSDPGSASFTAVMDWSADPDAPRPGLEHYHLEAGATPAMLSPIGPEGLRDVTWVDDSPWSAALPSVRYLRVVAADGCEVEAR